MSDVKLEFSPEIMGALIDAGVVKQRDGVTDSRIEFSDTDDVMVVGYDEDGKKVISEQLDESHLKAPMPASVFNEKEIEERTKNKSKWYSIITIVIGFIFIVFVLLFIASLYIWRKTIVG